MSFFHPGLLWLAPLALIPVLLHLLTLHRLKTVELSTFRFLFDSYVQQRRQIKFLEAILAALRTLFLLFVVFVVARPVIQHWSGLFGSGSGRNVIMLVDCSASMNARTAGVASIDRARSAALAVAERFRPEDRLTLVRVTSRPEEVFSRFTSDADAIREKIESLATSPSRANLYAAFSELFASSAYRRTGQTVYLFTDCQASGWREIKDQSLAGVLPADTELVVVNVGSAVPLANRAVIGDAPREGRVVVGLPVVLRPRVVNHSKTEPSEVTVSVTMNEKQIDRVTLGLKPGETASREVVYMPREPGVERARFEISGDPFPDDDAFLFTLQVVPQIKVLVVSAAPTANPLDSETLFVNTAMQSRPERSSRDAASPAAPELGPGDDFVRALDVQEINEQALNPAVLEAASVVVVANAALGGPQFALLRDFVRSGGGLILFPGDKVNPDTYNKQFFAPPGPNQPALIAARLAAPLGNPDQLEESERLGAIDYAHPVLSVFDDPQARYLTTAQFFRRFPIELAEERAQTWPLAHFTSGKPAIIEARYGQGDVLLTAFPATAKWSNLPLKPEFVPLMLRMASHVMRRAEVEVPSVVPSSGTAEIAVAGRWAPVTVQVVDPARHTTTVPLERSNDRLVGAFDKTQEKGYYTVDINGGRSEQPRHAAAAFAVNLAPDESNFAMVNQENLRDWLPGQNVKLIDASAEAQHVQGGIGQEREVWRPLIALLFVIIGVEFMLSTLGGVRDKDQPTVAERIRNINPGTWVGRMTGANS